MKLNQSIYCRLKIEDNISGIILTPGDSIFISSDFSSNKAPFSGTAGALLNNYIISDMYFTDEIEEKTDFDAVFSLIPMESVNILDSLARLRENRLEMFIANNKALDH